MVIERGILVSNRRRVGRTLPLGIPQTFGLANVSLFFFFFISLCVMLNAKRFFVSFLHEELSWSISKVDDELTPIVQRISLRGKHGALNKQGTLDPFFDLSAGAGQYYAPRRRPDGGGGTNVSKRLMGVIKQFKEAEARISRGEDVDAILAEEKENKAKGKRKADEDEDGDGEDEKEGGNKKKKKKTSARGRMRAGTASSVGDSVKSSEGTSRSTSTSGRGRGGSRGRGRARGKSK